MQNIFIPVKVKVSAERKWFSQWQSLSSCSSQPTVSQMMATGSFAPFLCLVSDLFWPQQDRNKSREWSRSYLFLLSACGFYGLLLSACLCLCCFQSLCMTPFAHPHSSSCSWFLGSWCWQLCYDQTQGISFLLWPFLVLFFLGFSVATDDLRPPTQMPAELAFFPYFIS